MPGTASAAAREGTASGLAQRTLSPPARWSSRTATWAGGLGSARAMASWSSRSSGARRSGRATQSSPASRSAEASAMVPAAPRPPHPPAPVTMDSVAMSAGPPSASGKERSRSRRSLRRPRRTAPRRGEPARTGSRRAVTTTRTRVPAGNAERSLDPSASRTAGHGSEREGQPSGSYGLKEREATNALLDLPSCCDAVASARPCERARRSRRPSPRRARALPPQGNQRARRASEQRRRPARSSRRVYALEPQRGKILLNIAI